MDFMKIIVPSSAIREIEWVIDDWDAASILYNSVGVPLAEKIAWLRELGGQTQDQVLAEQIEQRLALEEETREVFFRSASGMFYMAAAGDDKTPLGYYATAEDAIRRGKREGGAFDIYKYRLIGILGPPVWKSGHSNPYFSEAGHFQEDSDDDQDEDCCWVGCMGFNPHGVICFVSSCEALSVSEAEWVELEFSPKRFEHRYIKLPNPFQRGDIVQVVAGSMKGCRGVVETSQEEWAHFQDRVKNGLYADFSDACITVEFPTKNGFSHDHISPLYLERCQPGKDDWDYDILQVGSSMIRGQCSLDYFTYTCQKYREKELSQCPTPTSYS